MEFSISGITTPESFKLEVKFAWVSTTVVVVTYSTITVSVAGSNDGRKDGISLGKGDILGDTDTEGDLLRERDGEWEEDVLGVALGKLLGIMVGRPDGGVVGDVLGISDIDREGDAVKGVLGGILMEVVGEIVGKVLGVTLREVLGGTLEWSDGDMLLEVLGDKL